MTDASLSHPVHLLPVVLILTVALFGLALELSSGQLSGLGAIFAAVVAFDLLTLAAQRMYRRSTVGLLRASPYLHAAALAAIWVHALYLVPAAPMARDVLLLSSFVFPALYVPFFTRLNARRALRRAALLLGAFAALHVPHALMGLSGPYPLDGLIFPLMVFTPQGVLLAFLAYLASYAQQAHHAQVRAAQLERQATRDALTGAANRWHSEALLAAALAGARAGQPCGVLFLDIDHFKRVNDRYGHGAGDAVLQEVARRVGQALRPEDALGRWGGEEFIVLAPLASLLEAHTLGERLRAAVREVAPAGGEPVSISVGGAVYTPGDTPETLLARADRALYRAKHSGRDRTVVKAAQVSPAPPS